MKNSLSLAIFFQHPKQAKVSRRFLVVEGIYINTGKVCNIEPMVELKRKYKLRFFIDETVSFGTLGEHGKGITEYKNIAVRVRLKSLSTGCLPDFLGTYSFR